MDKDLRLMAQEAYPNGQWLMKCESGMALMYIQAYGVTHYTFGNNPRRGTGNHDTQ